MLADAEVEVAAAVAAGLEVAGALEGQAGLGRGGQVGRAADQPGHVLGQRVEHLARRDSRVAMPLASAGNVGRSLSQPSGSWRCCIRSSWSASSGYLALYSLELGEPGVAELLAAAADALLEVLVDAVGDQELGVLGPAVELLGQPDLVLAQRLAVGAVRVLLVGRAPGDVAVDDDQGRPVVGLQERL